MLSRFANRLARRLRRLDVWIVRLGTPAPIRRQLFRSSDEVLDRALAAAGLWRDQLFSVVKGNAPRRKRMATMLLYFGVDRVRASELHWQELRMADSVCANCRNVRKCKRWLGWGVMPDTAHRFCPNAELFQELSLSLGDAGRSEVSAPI